MVKVYNLGARLFYCKCILSAVCNIMLLCVDAIGYFVICDCHNVWSFLLVILIFNSLKFNK